MISINHPPVCPSLSIRLWRIGSHEFKISVNFYSLNLKTFWVSSQYTKRCYSLNKVGDFNTDRSRVNFRLLQRHRFWQWLPPSGCTHNYNNNLLRWDSFSGIRLVYTYIKRTNTDKRTVFMERHLIPLHHIIKRGTRGSAVGWGTALQTGRSQVRFQMMEVKFFIGIILSVALWPRGRLSL
jgi:hypothetical protein